jgi:hypothetical protein
MSRNGQPGPRRRRTVKVEQPERAEVVYENDPYAIASTGNCPGRFVAPA